MAWYWEVITAVVVFDIVLVLAALVRSVTFKERGMSLLEERGPRSLPQESILRFLENLSLAEGEENTYLTANQKG